MESLNKITLIFTLLYLVRFRNAELMKYYTSESDEKIFYEGERQNGDRLIHNSTIRLPASDLGPRSQTFHYPDFRNREWRITRVQVIDQSKGDGQPELLKGGSGYRSIFLSLFAPRGQDLDYLIQIYVIDSPET